MTNTYFVLPCLESFLYQLIKIKSFALAGQLSWLEHRPVHQKVASSIPSRGTYLTVVWSLVRVYTGGSWSMFLSHINVCLSVSFFLSLMSSLSKINKRILGWGFKKIRLSSYHSFWSERIFSSLIIVYLLSCDKITSVFYLLWK